MDTKQVIQSQYLAALEMLKQVIVLCPAASWDAPGDNGKFWEKAYHTLFFVHLYLQESEAHFRPWVKHHDPDSGEPFSREDVLEYMAFVQEQVKARVPVTDLEAESGFDWLKFSKLELQFYSIRHIQQHTGELFERMDQQNIKLDWVGTRPSA